MLGALYQRLLREGLRACGRPGAYALLALSSLAIAFSGIDIGLRLFVAGSGNAVALVSTSSGASFYGPMSQDFWGDLVVRGPDGQDIAVSLSAVTSVTISEPMHNGSALAFAIPTLLGLLAAVGWAAILHRTLLRLDRLERERSRDRSRDRTRDRDRGGRRSSSSSSASSSSRSTLPPSTGAGAGAGSIRPAGSGGASARASAASSGALADRVGR